MKNNHLLIAWYQLSSMTDAVYTLKPCNSYTEALVELKKNARHGKEQSIVSMIYKDKNGKLHELK